MGLGLMTIDGFGRFWVRKNVKWADGFGMFGMFWVDGFGTLSEHVSLTENKLRWNTQQPQRVIFAKLLAACCEAKRWKHLSFRETLLNLTWLCTKASQTFSGTFFEAFFETLHQALFHFRPLF